MLIPIPGIIDTLWEGILKAVPKKKTSHMYDHMNLCPTDLATNDIITGRSDTGRWPAKA